MVLVIVQAATARIGTLGECHLKLALERSRVIIAVVGSKL